MSVFDQLEPFGIIVPEHDRYFPYITCWDMESILKPIDVVEERGVQFDEKQKLLYTEEHIPISCSIASNVDQFTDPHTIVCSDPDELVGSMVAHFYKIRDRLQVLVHAKWGGYYGDMRGKIEARLHYLSREFDLLDCCKTSASFKKHMQRDVYLKQMCKVADKFRRYIN